MDIQYKILKYVIEEYGMEKHPCYIPKNDFESFKIDFYLWIKRKVSEKLFYFIRDRIWSIKYLDENPNGNIPIIYRDKETGRIVVEFFIERKKDFHPYLKGYKKASLLKGGGDIDNWVLNTYEDNSIIVTEIKNEKKYKEIVDHFLSKIRIFAPIVREKRINKVLN